MRFDARVVMAAALLLATACTASSAETVQPRGGRSGLQGTGTLDGRQLAVAQGLPDLIVGDCDPRDGRDDDVCFVSSTIDGQTFVLTIENPVVLEEGATLPVGADCGSPEACDAVTDRAVVSIKVGTDPPVTATGGTLTVTTVEPFLNYAGDVTLQLPGGRFSGTFDVVPRPE